MQTTLRRYCFDIREPAGEAAWRKLKARLTAGRPRRFGPVLADVYRGVAALDGVAVTLETGHLFDNQWSTSEGVRVFDWALESVPAFRRFERRGHYLEQTDEMREIRRNRNACGYCGHQEEAQRGLVFCDRCRGNAYLKTEHLHLTRMVCVADGHPRPELTEAERSHLLPLYREAQTYGGNARDKARIAKARADLAAKRDRLLVAATVEHDGMTWLMDRGISTDNVIYYSHTGRFCFGWRSDGLDPEAVAALVTTGAEFRWPYDIKCTDGRTLSGEG